MTNREELFFLLSRRSWQLLLVYLPPRSQATGVRVCVRASNKQPAGWADLLARWRTSSPYVNPLATVLQKSALFHLTKKITHIETVLNGSFDSLLQGSLRRKPSLGGKRESRNKLLINNYVCSYSWQQAASKKPIGTRNIHWKIQCGPRSLLS